MSEALVPAGFERYTVPVGDPIERSGATCVRFFHGMSELAGEIQAQCKGVKPADPILCENGKFTKLDPFRFHILDYKRLWVEREQGKQALNVATEDPGNRAYKEEIHAVILVYVDDRVVPATCVFKSGLCKGVIPAINDLIGMRDGAFMSDWARRTPEHNVAAGIALPFARFVVEMSTKQSTSKSTGYKYFDSQSTMPPTNAGDYSILGKALTDAQDAVAKVQANHDARVQDLLKLAA